MVPRINTIFNTISNFQKKRREDETNLIVRISGELKLDVQQRIPAAVHVAVPWRAAADRRVLGEQRRAVPRPPQLLRCHEPGDRRAVPARPLLEDTRPQLRLHRGRR